MATSLFRVKPVKFCLVSYHISFHEVNIRRFKCPNAADVPGVPRKKKPVPTIEIYCIWLYLYISGAGLPYRTGINATEKLKQRKINNE